MDSTKTGPIRIDFKSEKTVFVMSDDEDRFFTTSKEAARACKQAENVQEWETQFTYFLLYLRDWCITNKENVESAYLTVGDSSLNILIYIYGHDYDFEFEDILVKLDSELFNKFPLCSAEVLQIPNQPSLKEQPTEMALCLYGDIDRSSESG